MFDLETLVTAVYVTIDEFVRTHLGPDPVTCGQKPALCRSEVLTLALISQLPVFSSERSCLRWAAGPGHTLFPHLPHRAQVNRAIRRQQAVLVQYGRTIARQLGALSAEFEILDSTAVPVRNDKRRGTGHLPDVVAIGHSQRLGWFAGVRLLATVTPDGVLTGYALGEATANDRVLAEQFFAHRAEEIQVLPEVGRPSSGIYLADTGFAGRACRERWAAYADAHVYAPPQRDSHEVWPAALRQHSHRIRQIIETVFQRLHQPLRLDRERPHTLQGLHARVAAKIALHNWLIAWNRQCARPDLTVVGVIGW